MREEVTFARVVPPQGHHARKLGPRSPLTLTTNAGMAAFRVRADQGPAAPAKRPPERSLGRPGIIRVRKPSCSCVEKPRSRGRRSRTSSSPKWDRWAIGVHRRVKNLNHKIQQDADEEGQHKHNAKQSFLASFIPSHRIHLQRPKLK